MNTLKRIITVSAGVMLILLMSARGASAETGLLSQGKRVWSNSEEASNPASNLVDGSTSNNWAALDGGYNKEFTIDLGNIYDLTEIKLYPKENRAYKYKVYVSTDGADINQLVVDKSDNSSGSECYTDSLSGFTARYIRVYISGEKNNKWVSFYEAEVYGDTKPVGKENVALEKTVINVTGEQASEGNYASMLVDGTMVGHWAAEGTASATVDLGEPFYIDSTEIVPEGNRAYGYKIEASYDNITYTTVIDKSGNTAENSVHSDSFAAVEARYVRLSITNLPSGVAWTNIKEFSVFGDKEGVDIDARIGIEKSTDGCTVSVSGTSCATRGRVMTLIVAAFDGDKMTGYYTETLEIPAYGEAIDFSVFVTDEELGGLANKVVEAFIWDDLGNMKSQTATAI